MNGIAEDVGQSVARAIDKCRRGKLKSELACEGCYMITVKKTTTEHPEIVVEVRVPMSLFTLGEGR